MGRSKRNVSSRVYQLRVELAGIAPPIWRRIQVPGSTLLPDLHLMLQAAMGWTNGHLHGFTIEEINYSEPDPDFHDPQYDDERRVRLDEICPRAGMRFLYTYDFGDCWEHDVLVEKILPAEPGVDYPRCLAGERCRPPEDIGGVYGYEEFLEAIRNPKHDDHAQFVESFGEEFDPEEFDIDVVNGMLSDYKSLDMRSW